MTLWNRTDDRDPKAELTRLGDAIKSWYPEAYVENAVPFPDKPVLQHTFNGLLTLADWLGSDPKFFPYSTYDDRYINIARKRRSEEHTSELQSRGHLVCRLLLEKK